MSKLANLSCAISTAITSRLHHAQKMFAVMRTRLAEDEMRGFRGESSVVIKFARLDSSRLQYILLICQVLQCWAELRQAHVICCSGRYR